MISILIMISKNFLQDKLKYRTKPSTIQLPITGKCNSRCVTCNVWKNKAPVDLDPDELRKVLKQSYFNEVMTVGLNGGEPTLHRRFREVLDAVLELPKLRVVHLISNAMLSTRLLDMLEYCKQQCSAKGVIFNYTISIDGVNKVHNEVRGLPTAFERTMTSLTEIIKDKEKYCNNIYIGCTISKYNVFYMAEIDSYFAKYNLPVSYHLAVPNKRIGTFNSADYSVLADPRAKLMAEEFFLSKYPIEPNKILKIRYFINYFYLKHGGTNRLATCGYLHRDVTIDEHLNVYLCATASDRIGNLKENTFDDLIKNGQVKMIEERTSHQCDTCIHYVDYPSLRGLFIFLKYSINDRLKWSIKFKYLAKW